MKKTQNYNLNLPEKHDVVNIDDLNENTQFIDKELFKKADKSYVDEKIGDIDFTELEEKIDRKADIFHVHSANDITETYNRNFVSTAEKLNISKIDNKADKNHSHSASDINETYSRKFVSNSQLNDINTISNKAEKEHSHSANDIIETFNRKFVDVVEKDKIDKIDDKADKDAVARTSTIVIANYDSHENSKKSADIVINKWENASEKINNAIQSLKNTGGEVKLMEGNYNLEYGIAVNVDGVHLTGVPGVTILVQNENWKSNPINNRSNVVEIDGDVYISNLIVEGNKTSFSSNFYCSGSSQVINCISNNSGVGGFYCSGSSQVINCISNNSTDDGFYCGGSSQVINCISNNSTSNGFYCSNLFKGVCTFNILKRDRLNDRSSTPAIVEYNIIQEG